MSTPTAPRRGSLFLPVVVIAFGALFLLTNVLPSFNPWPIVSRWWPLLLILVGLGKLWDYTRLRNDPSATPVMGITGGGIALLILAVFFAAGVSRSARGQRDSHIAETRERQGAESVRVHVEMGTGELKIAGGAAKLLEADFNFSEADGQPKITYDVAGNQGRLTIRQPETGPRFGDSDSTWDLRFANDVPMDMKVEMGAGSSTLRLGGLALSKLDVHMGAGELIVDLTGDWKKDVEVSIQGGAGSATVRLPRNVGVRAYASGGIGSINARGLERRGGAYVNDALGKSPVTLRVNVHGGVGEINLISEP